MQKIFLSLGIFIFISLFSFGQQSAATAHGWHLSDITTDSVYGISLDKAYAFLAEKKIKPVLITVGVLDGGTDITHEDLKPVLWTNPKEIPGNQKDDDGNGYADDVHGWNFLGNPDGRNVLNNSSEWIRVYWRYKEIYEGKAVDTATMSALEKYQYTSWIKARSGVVGKGMKQGQLDTLRENVGVIVFCDSIFQQLCRKKVYDLSVVQSFQPKNDQQGAVKEVLTDFLKQFSSADIKSDLAVNEFKNYLHGEEAKSTADKIPPVNDRLAITGNDETDAASRWYGNADIAAGETLHGTHVAGIIAAVRHNGKGMDGIADAVRILTVRTTPDGDEFDKDIATGIRYAVDNGAKVINMSFGKSLSPDKIMIDDAVKYALSKDVLLVQAAGNSKRNINGFDNYPNPRYLLTDSMAPHWITVGAANSKGAAAEFSNYGDKVVDVFAPGVAIYSSVPNKDRYMNLDGTSMASPVVTGIAALIRSYFPKLTAVQVKDILLRSAVKPVGKGLMPGTDKMVSLDELCSSGGIVNAYEAVKLAYSISSRAGK